MKEIGYVKPLLSNLAVDYSAKVREGLVGPILFPRVTVDKPSGKYAFYDAENAYKVPDTTMAGERAQANEFNDGGTMKDYVANPQGLKSFIDNAKLEKMDGPFKMWEKRKTEMLVGKLELSQEKRIANKVANLANRNTVLAGEGAGKANKWSNPSANTGGDPHSAIVDAISHLFFRPNLMVIPESVFDAIEYHPRLISKLGEANIIKKVDEETLSKLFRINRVIIAKGKADFGKRKSDKELNVASIWGANVTLAYVDDAWDAPCAGKTLAVDYTEADSQGYIVRTWDDPSGGIKGGEWLQVAHEVDELVVCNELIYTIKDVL